MPLDPHQLSSIQPNPPPHASLAPVPWLSPPPTRSRSQRHGRALATSRNCRSGAAADSAAKREKGRPPAAGASPAFRQHTQSMRSARTTHGAPIRGGAILRPSARRMLLGEYDPSAGPTPSDPDECFVARLSDYRVCLPGLRDFLDGSRFHSSTSACNRSPTSAKPSATPRPTSNARPSTPSACGSNSTRPPAASTSAPPSAKPSPTPTRTRKPSKQRASRSPSAT
jgi:hypothetical protein